MEAIEIKDEPFPPSIINEIVEPFKQNLSIKSAPASSPNKLIKQTLKKTPVKTPNKLDGQNQIESNLSNECTPDKRNRNISLCSINDLFTPSKMNDFYDASHLDGFEVVNMLHDENAILDFDKSMLDFTPPDVIIKTDDVNVEPATDPLLNVSVNDTESNTKMEQSPIEETVKRRSSRKSNRSIKASLVKKTPKIKFKTGKYRTKSNSFHSSEVEDFFSSEEEIEKEAHSILEEVYNAQEEELLSLQTIKKLKHLEIRLIHKVPRQHKIENSSGCRQPTQKQKNLFEKYVTMVKGKFTEEEDNIIERNWKYFCKIHRWDEENVRPFLRMSHGGKIYLSNFTERKKFVQFLANGLPCRTLYSVYHRFRKIFSRKFHFGKGRFSRDEDRKIMIYMKCAKDSNQQFSELSKILGRSKITIWKRYQILKKKSTSNSKRKKEQKIETKVIWTVPLIEKFLKNFMEVTLIEDVKELKNLVIPKVIWEEMQTRMLIDQNILKNYWFQKLHLQLFSQTPIHLNDVKIKLIEYLYETAVSNPREINWPEVRSLFDGMTTAFLCEIVFRLVRHVRRKDSSMSFPKIVDYLYDIMIPALKMQSEDKDLPRISFKDNTVIILEGEGEKNEENKEDDEDDEDFTIRISKKKLKEYQVPRRRSDRLNSSRKKRIEFKDNSDIVWSLSKREEFVKNLLDLMIFKDIQELKDVIIPKVVWEKMGKKMKMDSNILADLWYDELHLQLFSPNIIYMNDLKIKLIELIYKQKVTSLKEINWPKVCGYFDGMTSVLISQVFSDLVDSASREIDSNDFCDIMEYLYKSWIPKLINQQNDKYLPRITFKDNTYIILGEEEGKKGEKDENLNVNVNVNEENGNENRNGDGDGKENKDFTIRESKKNFEKDQVPRICSEILNFPSKKRMEFKDNSNIVWSLSKREEFVKNLLDLMIFKDLLELKDAIIPKVVWDEMGNKMKVDSNILTDFWYKELHLQLFYPNKIYMNDLKIKLIELIYKQKVTSLKEVNWPKVCGYFDGMTSVLIYQIFSDLVDSASREIDSNNFHDIMEYLYKSWIPKLISQQNDKYLPRITFKENTLKILEEEVEIKEEKDTTEDDDSILRILNNKFENDQVPRRRSGMLNSPSEKEKEFKDNSHIVWSLSKREELIKNLLDLMIFNDLQDLKDAIIPKVVWDKIEDRMNVDQHNLKELWYYELHMQLFCQKPIYMNDIKIKLIEYFHNEPVTDLREIIWPSVCKYFDGLTTIFLTRLLYNLVRSASKEINSYDFYTIMEYLHEKKVPSLKNEVSDEVLPRLFYDIVSNKIVVEDIKEEI